jgi:Type I phosphodiesterase / nucleotide pyrophosphatase
MKTTTFADEIDRALGNEPLVGMVAWRNWHLGMMGHGAALPGGDHDQLALISHSTRLTTNDRFYAMPTYLRDFPGLKRRAAQADRADGTVDGRWMGHKVLEMHDNPTWIWYLSDVIHAVIEREGYGQDDVPDFLFTNFKMTDIVGHQYTMDSREMAGVLEEQDRALGRLVDYLDESVGDYVLVVTADHGHTPAPQVSGGWPVAKGELEADIEDHFASQGDELVENISATGIFLDATIMNELGIEAEEVARFVNGYTLKENWPEQKLPKDYLGRADEQVFSAAFTEKQLPEVIECAFGDVGPGAP